MAVENPFDQKRGYQFSIEVDGEIRPLRDHVIVTDMNFEGRKLSSGILLLNDDGKTNGIRPRWARVFAVGPEQHAVKPGQWVFIEHGRWSRGLKISRAGEEIVIRRADPNCIIFVSDTEPGIDDTVSGAVYAEQKTRD